MIQVVPNSGILFDDFLDQRRAKALVATRACLPGGLPEPVVEYIRALEDRYLDRLHRDHKASLADIPFDVDENLKEKWSAQMPTDWLK